MFLQSIYNRTVLLKVLRGTWRNCEKKVKSCDVMEDNRIMEVSLFVCRRKIGANNKIIE